MEQIREKWYITILRPELMRFTRVVNWNLRDRRVTRAEDLSVKSPLYLILAPESCSKDVLDKNGYAADMEATLYR